MRCAGASKLGNFVKAVLDGKTINIFNADNSISKTFEYNDEYCIYIEDGFKILNMSQAELISVYIWQIYTSHYNYKTME